MRASSLAVCLVLAASMCASDAFVVSGVAQTCRWGLALSASSSDDSFLPPNMSSRIPTDGIRARKLALYEELFQLDVAGDVRNHAAKQIAVGQSPFFESRKDKAALYDKLFSSGTVDSDGLVEAVDRIRSGKTTKESQVEGVDPSAFRRRLGNIEW